MSSQVKLYFFFIEKTESGMLHLTQWASSVLGVPMDWIYTKHRDVSGFKAV